MKNYTLNIGKAQAEPSSVLGALKKLLPLLAPEKKSLVIAGFAILVNSGLTLLAPVLIGHTVDSYIQTKQFGGVLQFGAILFVIYFVALIAGYIQTKTMGAVGQRLLYRLRHQIFGKLQELPVAFFNQNKAGDLISRINNDTDRLNQFFSRGLVQFISNIFLMIGAAIFVLWLNPRLGAAALAPAAAMLIVTRLLSPWVRRQNAVNAKSTGGLSAEIQESLNNFKVIVAFNRRDYFRAKFSEVNDANYRTAVGAGLANNIFTPIYSLASNLAQLAVLAYGIVLVMQGSFTIGLLISYLVYITRFYDPIRQMATVWADFQVALSGWDRIAAILAMESDMTELPAPSSATSVADKPALLEFKHVHFRYAEDKDVLKDINFRLQPGKTYALVGPTGGGKTTTASLMARLFDPSEGTVLLDGRDIRTFSAAERTKKIGFILQEPILFGGTVGENIVYGHPEYQSMDQSKLAKLLEEKHLAPLLVRFDQGLETKVTANGDSISLGQKQLIAFMRAVLRDPELLILDEATANIDTVTEQMLETVLDQLPASTTRVIIAHRLNTIANADEIFFVNGGSVTPAGSLDQAVEMLLHQSRKS